MSTLFPGRWTGVNSAAIGLVIAACPQLYRKAVTNNAGITVFLFTGALIKWFNAPAPPVAIFMGGLLGFALTQTPTAIDFAQKGFCE